MNLMSNAIKFTKKDGEIKLYMKLYPTTTSREILKQPIESNPFIIRTRRKPARRLNTDENANINDSLEQEICPNTDVLDSQSREFDSNEDSNRMLKLKYLKGIKRKSRAQTGPDQNDSNEDSIPWIIIKEDQLSSIPARVEEATNNESLRLPNANRGFS